MKFKDFIGNNRVTEQLGALMDSDRFPHAIIIEGEQGLGKKTLARELATALVCRGEEKPCYECSQCKKAMGKIHPDIYEYIPSGTANSFHVDTVRDIINDAYMQPNEADFKVYILANAECMNTSAQNALLKILEEPPAYVVFILTVNSKSALLSTVLSRSVTVTLEGVSISEGAKHIASRNENIDFIQAEKTLETFNGNIGKAVDSLKDTKAAELVGVCNDICKALENGDEYGILTACSAFQKDRQSIVFFCDFLKNIFRDALTAGNGCEYISGQAESAELLKSCLSRQSLLRLVQACDDLKKTALMNVNNSLIITKICYSLKNAVSR
ncbi:MAG: ATP-binding protein [Eubacterium sp.]